MSEISILCGREIGSPKVLAETLHEFLKADEIESTVYYEVKAFRRLFRASQVKYNLLVWMLYKLRNFVNDQRLYKKLKNSDAVIICDWTPHGFYKESYNIVRLKKILPGVPIIYYAVQFLGNSPTQMERLSSSGHAMLERYDWHLSVSSITEIRQEPKYPWSQIGLFMKGAGLQPLPKKKFFAIVDFLRPGYETYREEQIRVLTELEIPFVSLEKRYSLEEIRDIYSSASLFFIQFPEAFGMPIAECLSFGCMICTPHSSWPMAWRLDKSPEVHGPGTLDPDCFMVYSDYNGMKEKLTQLKARYNVKETPFEVFNSFLNNYPSFYEGNRNELLAVVERIKKKEI